MTTKRSVHTLFLSLALALLVALAAASPAWADMIYVVRPGDTLGTISAKFHISARAIMDANHLANPNLLYSGQPLIIPGVGGSTPASYTVARGDTLFSIAQRYGLGVSAILAANPDLNANRIYPGQVIALTAGAAASSASAPAASPAPTAQAPSPGGGVVTYIVQRGDTLSSIAARFGTSVGALKAANGLASDIIYRGQTLIVSGGADPEAVAQRARAIFLAGQPLGNQPHVFTLVGDSNTSTPLFMDVFDVGNYDRDKYAPYQATLDYFHGSFAAGSVAAQGAYTTKRELEPAPEGVGCNPDEAVAACEYRLRRPAIAVILLGTNGAGQWWFFEASYRQVIEITLANGVIPVLTTKADSTERQSGVGANYVNDRIRRFAVIYQLPLIDLYAATRSLPNKGLQADGFHLTPAAQGVRNLITVQMLDWLRAKVLYDAP